MDNKINVVKNILFAIFPILITQVALANYHNVRNFTRNTYKAGSQNWGIAQDKNNVMYFANNTGLLEFDGKNWSTYPIMNGTDVRSILFDGKERIYASTFNEFGYYQRTKDYRLEYTSILSKSNILPGSSNELYNIHKGNRGEIYFQSKTRIFVYEKDSLSNIKFPFIIDASGFVNGELYIASSQGGIFILVGQHFFKIPDSEILINKKICSILPYDHSSILFVTNFNGAYIFDGYNIKQYNIGIDDFLKKNQVFCATTNDKKIVFGTVQRGIAIYDKSNKNITYNNTYTGLQNNTVLSLCFDGQQNLWIGLDKGIDYVMLNSPILNMFGTNNLYGAGYTSLKYNSILYFGTNQGLYKKSLPFQDSPLPLNLEPINEIKGQIWSLTEIDHSVFCGSDLGAFIIHPNYTEKIGTLTGTWSFKKLLKHPNLILGCSYQGLFILRKTNNNWKFSHFIRGNFSETSPMFEEDDDESIWFSHWQKGLFRLFLNESKDSIVKIDLYNETKGFPSNRNNTVFRIKENLVFSSENGLFYYDSNTDQMILDSKWNNLFSSLPRYIRLHENKSGDVWCVSGKFVGIARKKSQGDSYEMDSLTYQILQTKIISGFENFNFIDSVNVILSSQDGFCWINENIQLTKPTNTLKVFYRSITSTNGTELNLSNLNLTDIVNFQHTFSHKNNSLRFEFIAPEFRNEALVKYSYILKNYDHEWSEFKDDNIKEYTQLPKGEYTFMVKANNLMEHGEASCSFDFKILPAWYESRIAIIIYFICLVIIMAFIIIWVNNRSKKGAIEMEMKKEIEINEQKKKFDEEATEKKREIKELKNQQLQYELRHKAQELASSTMNLIRKNEMLMDMLEGITMIRGEIKSLPNSNSTLSRLSKIEKAIKDNIEIENNWKRFEENFDMVYENYLKRLSESFTELNMNDKKLCAYLKMGLASKDIAPLMNVSIRSVETNRFRLRKKMNLSREENLSDFLQKF
ncbi:transcriptional regulator [Paludibacter sp.]